jgi:acylphosphatase
MIGVMMIFLIQILDQTISCPMKILISEWNLMMIEKRLHARVEGRVQGVGFRYYVMTSATELGLVGWVRNRRDGSVEVVAEGELTLLKKLVRAIERGSRSSKVSNVKVDLQEASGEFVNFTAKPTL